MRRLLVSLLIFTGLLTVLGCGEGFQNPLGSHLAGKPFGIGRAEQYRAPGVYQGFRESGVWIVSFRGMVVALSTACPHDGYTTHFDEMTQQFRCAHCAARYDSNGLPRAPRDATASLVRYRIEATDSTAPPREVELRINTRFQFRQERNEWGSRFAYYGFEGE